MNIEMGKPYRLAPRAIRDLEDIWNYGVAQWSVDQAQAYSKKLFATFDFLSANPKAARNRDEFFPPVRIYPLSAHLIIYRVYESHIEIVRIRHAGEDWINDPAND